MAQSHSRKLVGRPIVAANLAASLLALVLGCQRHSENAAPTVRDEPTLAAQAAAVRAGESNQIVVRQEWLSDADLDLLDELGPAVVRVNLSRTSVTDAGLARLARLENLEQLRLGSKLITDNGIAHLIPHAKLRQLHLIGAPLTDAGLAQLQAMKSLDSLYLDGIQASDQAIDALAKALPNVHLHIDGGHHATDPHPHEQ